MRVLSFSFLVFLASNLMSQDLEKHLWENRLLLIFTDDKNSEKLNNQIRLFSKDKKGLLERKLVIYQFAKNEFRTNFTMDWFSSKKTPKLHRRTSKDFEVVLLGLDGGVKYRQTKIISLTKLFTLIDGMPMRKRELKN